MPQPLTCEDLIQFAKKFCQSKTITYDYKVAWKGCEPASNLWLALSAYLEESKKQVQE